MDAKKHVKPLAVNPISKEDSKIEKKDGDFDQSDIDRIMKNYQGNMKTLTKYSYYEASNGKWVKALISIDNIKSVPKDKISVIFGERTLDIFVKDFGPKNDQILHFGCRKLHCYVIPSECKWVIKSDGIQVCLKKRKESDNWWSFFKAKATGEVDSDLEDDK